MERDACTTLGAVGRPSEAHESALLQVRAEVGQYDGVEVIVKAMKLWASSGGVQCNGCLAIVSLVRAESEVCQVGLLC